MKQNRILAFVAALVVAGSLAMWSGSQSTVHAQGGDRQPHMEAALRHLKEAQEELQAANENKGGHRGKAIRLVEQAITEVDAGIHHADKD